MARSRLGGSRRKLHGKVGSTVYQVSRDADGRYQQVVYALPEDRELALTPALAQQRMFMSMVMRHMNLLKPFMAAAFEGIPEGTMSVQEFTRVNVEWLKAHYADTGDIKMRIYFPLYGENLALPFPAIITAGTFKVSAFSEPAIWYDDNQVQIMVTCPRWDADLTLKEWQDKHDWHYGEMCCALWFTLGANGYDPHYRYVRFKWKSGLDPNRLLSEYDSSDFFDVDGNINGRFRLEWNPNHMFRKLVFRSNFEEDFQHMEYGTNLQFGWQNGKWRLSNSQLKGLGAMTVPASLTHTYAEAYKSWYTDRIPTPPPPPPPHVYTYQEVEYVQALAACKLSFPFVFHATEQVLWASLSRNDFRNAFFLSCDNAVEYSIIRALGNRLYGAVIDGDGSTRTAYSNIQIYDEFQNVKLFVRDNKVNFIVNDVVNSSGIGNFEFNPNLGHLLLFKLYFPDAVCRLGYIKITAQSDDSILHDVIPCYRKSDGMKGYFDKITHEFIYDERDQSALQCGPDIGDGFDE